MLKRYLLEWRANLFEIRTLISRRCFPLLAGKFSRNLLPTSFCKVALFSLIDAMQYACRTLRKCIYLSIDFTSSKHLALSHRNSLCINCCSTKHFTSNYKQTVDLLFWRRLRLFCVDTLPLIREIPLKSEEVPVRAVVSTVVHGSTAFVGGRQV